MAAALALLPMAASLAEAQTPLGGGADRPLSVTASTFVGYDTDITARGTQPSASRPDVNTGATNGGVALTGSYAGGRRVHFYTVGSTEYRYYRAEQIITAPLASGSAGFGTDLGRRTRINGMFTSTYYPRFQLSVLPPTTDIPVDEPQPTLDYGISNQDIVSYSGTIFASYRISPRSSVSVNYSLGHFRYLGQEYALNTQAVGAGYSRNLTRYATMQLGYSEMGGDYATVLTPNQPTARRRTIDAGINYSRPLSLSRRTAVGFATGSTALDNGTNTFYTVTGNAHLRHQLSRTWNLGVAYTRGVGLVGGFSEPIFSDATSASTSGAVGRVFLRGTAGYTNGRVGLQTSDSNFKSVQSSATVTVPVTRRRLSVFGTYFYYRHLFDRSASLPLGLVPKVSRQGVRAGLTLKIY